MTTTQSRKARGMRTQLVVAQWFQQWGWTHATSTGSGRGGRDIENTPGVSIEVKARSDLKPLEWLRQAEAASGMDLPLVVFRPNGIGEENVDQWGVLMRLGTATQLLADAGYIPDDDEPPSDHSELY